jgi:hypothetical protein
MVVEMLVWMVG